MGYAYLSGTAGGNGGPTITVTPTPKTPAELSEIMAKAGFAKSMSQMRAEARPSAASSPTQAASAAQAIKSGSGFPVWIPIAAAVAIGGFFILRPRKKR